MPKTNKLPAARPLNPKSREAAPPQKPPTKPAPKKK